MPNNKQKEICDLADGDFCPVDECDGVLEVEEVEGCSCHIAPPCSRCVNADLFCRKCGWSLNEIKEEA